MSEEDDDEDDEEQEEDVGLSMVKRNLFVLPPPAKDIRNGSLFKRVDAARKFLQPAKSPPKRSALIPLRQNRKRSQRDSRDQYLLRMNVFASTKSISGNEDIK